MQTPAEVAGMDWQTPAALVVVALAAAGLLVAAWRKRRRGVRGCGAGGEGCGCDGVKKALERTRGR